MIWHTRLNSIVVLAPEINGTINTTIYICTMLCKTWIFVRENFYCTILYIPVFRWAKSSKQALKYAHHSSSMDICATDTDVKIVVVEILPILDQFYNKLGHSSSVDVVITPSFECLNSCNLTHLC